MERWKVLVIATLLLAPVLAGGCGLFGVGSTAGAVYAILEITDEEEDEEPPPPPPIIDATVSATGRDGGRITALAADASVGTPVLYAGTWRAGMYTSTNGGSTWTLASVGFDRNLSVTDVILDPTTATTVFAATGQPYAGGVFVSTDSAATWTRQTAGLAHVDVRCLAMATSGTLYAGTGGAGLYRGTVAAGVITWEACATTNMTNLFVSDVVVAGDSDLFVSTEGGGVFHHDDTGAPAASAWTWTAANSGLTTLQVTRLTHSSNLLRAGTAAAGVFEATASGGAPGVFTQLTLPGDAAIQDLQDNSADALDLWVGTPSGIYFSTDGGTSWSSPTTDPTDASILRVLLEPGSSTDLYAGAYAGGVYVSVDSGDTWTSSSTGLAATDFDALAVDPQSVTNTTAYAGMWVRDAGGSSRGGWSTSNGGSTWTQMTDGTTLTGRDIRTLIVDPVTASTLYAATWGSGVYQSTNSGSTWSQVNFGLGSNNVYALAIDPSTPARLYAGTDVGLYYTIDSGSTWTASLTQPEAGRVTLVLTGVSGIFANGETVTGGTSLASGTVLSGGGTSTLVVERTAGQWTTTETVTGTTSTATGTLFSATYTWYVADLTVDPTTATTVWCVTTGALGGVYTSTDSGLNWAATSGQAGSTRLTCFCADLESSTTYFVGTEDGGVWRTTDSGANWTQAATTMGAVTVTHILADGRRSSTGTWRVFAATAAGLFLTKDQGATWEAVRDAAPVNTIRPGLRTLEKLGLDPLAGNEDLLWAASGGRGLFKIALPVGS